MDTGLTGCPGARAAPHAATARGQEAVLVQTQHLLREANHVREVMWIQGFAIYVNVQVNITCLEELLCPRVRLISVLDVDTIPTYHATVYLMLICKSRVYLMLTQIYD